MPFEQLQESGNVPDNLRLSERVEPDHDSEVEGWRGNAQQCHGCRCLRQLIVVLLRRTTPPIKNRHFSFSL